MLWIACQKKLTEKRDLGHTASRLMLLNDQIGM